jgi:hypothetical protein
MDIRLHVQKLHPSIIRGGARRRCRGGGTPHPTHERVGKLLHSFGNTWAVWIWIEVSSNWIISIETKRKEKSAQNRCLENVLYRVVAGNLNIQNSPTCRLLTAVMAGNRFCRWSRSASIVEVVIWNLPQIAISETLDFKTFPGTPLELCVVKNNHSERFYCGRAALRNLRMAKV